MNRLKYILTADTQYNIQSPFLFEFYSEVLNSRLGKIECERHGIAAGDSYGELRFKLCDHYAAVPVEDEEWDADDLLRSSVIGLIGMVRSPHRDRKSEERWCRLVDRSEVTLSVDLFDVAIFFTNTKLSKQHVLFRCM